MFESLTTKIFISFAFIILLSFGALSIVLTDLMLEEKENALFDQLASQSRIHVYEYEKLANEGVSQKDILQDLKISLISNQQIISGNSEGNFSYESIESLLPPKGSIITTCKDLVGQPHLCSFSYLSTSKAWVFESFKKSDFTNILRSLSGRLLSWLFALLTVSLLLAYLLSRYFLKPLSVLTNASSQIASGEYESIKLRSNSTDEIGRLALAFENMAKKLQKREQNLAATGLKLAHSERLASIGQMGASIAHEVKNPLMSMKGYAKILKEKAQDPELREAAQIIYEESERCNNILQQMLKFARKDPSEKKAYRINEVIESSILLTRADAKRRQIKIESKLEDDVVLNGNAQQLQQVIVNLIINALHASSAGSSIEVSTHSSPDEDSVSIEIKDQGKGIPPEIQDKIFDPFFTTKEKLEGSGLGLSVVANIVSSQGGEINFNSQPDVGTSFQIRLPTAKA